jgi:hypothetical protein
MMNEAGTLKGCDKCTYPSQCRYPQESPEEESFGDVGLQTPTISLPTIKESEACTELGKGMVELPSSSNESVTFDQILDDILSEDRATVMEVDSPKLTKAATKTGWKGSTRKKS